MHVDDLHRTPAQSDTPTQALIFKSGYMGTYRFAGYYRKRSAKNQRKKMYVFADMLEWRAEGEDVL
jgi:hypothetical protein